MVNRQSPGLQRTLKGATWSCLQIQRKEDPLNKIPDGGANLGGARNKGHIATSDGSPNGCRGLFSLLFRFGLGFSMEGTSRCHGHFGQA